MSKDHLSSNYYDALDELKEAVSKSTAFNGYSGLLEMIKDGKYSAIPYAIEDYARLNINYSACTGTEYQGNTELVTRCSQDLLPDFTSSKLVQDDKSICDIRKQGEDVFFKNKGQQYHVKINSQANDKVTHGYPIMNTLLIEEGKNRVEFVFQYDLLVLAAAYRLDAQGQTVDVVKCK